MRRIASLLAVPLGIALSLTLGAASAEAKYKKPRETCETRIFQGEEAACFKSGDEYLLFRKDVIDSDPDAELVRPAPEADGFRVNGLECGCQLQRRLDFICAGRLSAAIGSVDRRGKWVRGETLSGDVLRTQNAVERVIPQAQQTKFLARRVATSECVILEK